MLPESICKIQFHFKILRDSWNISESRKSIAFRWTWLFNEYSSPSDIQEVVDLGTDYAGHTVTSLLVE